MVEIQDMKLRNQAFNSEQSLTHAYLWQESETFYGVKIKILQ